MKLKTKFTIILALVIELALGDDTDLCLKKH